MELEEVITRQVLIEILLNQQAWWSASGQLEYNTTPFDTASQMAALNHDLELWLNSISTT